MLKKFQYIPILILISFIFLDKHIHPDLKNILYLVLAFFPFLPTLSIFLFYLPFVVYGLLLGPSTFIKKYLFGFTLSFFSTVTLYLISLLTDIPINLPLLFFVFYAPVIIVIYKLLKKHRTYTPFINLYKIGSKEFIVLLISLLFLFFVTSPIINNQNLYMSNGTYVYTKFLSVVEGVKNFNEIPQYEPRIGEGEHLFITDTPIFYSNLGFLNLILTWIPSVLFYNSITIFIIWLSILGAWLLIYELLSGYYKKNDYLVYIIPLVGALSIILSFTFMQLFESFKQSSSYPFSFLALSLIVSFPQSSRKPIHLISIAAVLIVPFLIHATHSIGVILISLFLFLFLILQNKPKEQIQSAFTYAKKNKINVFAVFIILLFIPYFYLFPGYLYKNYARDITLPENFGPEFIGKSMWGYIKAFLADKNSGPLSARYPDIRRIDDKKFGFFFTFFGTFSLFFIIFLFRNKTFRNTTAFILAYISHFLFSSFLDSLPFFQALEYGTRTVLPFMLVVLIASIAVLIYSIPYKIGKIIMLLIFFSVFFHASFFVNGNLKNIHAESIISGETFRNEIEFVKQLPIDGRIMTYGFFSNAVDTAMAVLTNRYFSRYGYLQLDFTDNIYEKIHGANSFGGMDRIEPYSGTELANYLRLGGYKYVFLNICHPAGSSVINKLLPNNAYPIYQNPNQNCFVFLGINNTNYAEKVDIVNEANEAEYNNPNGYWFISFNKNKRIYDFNLEPHLGNTVEDPRRPEPLTFKRISPTQITIFGDFEKDDWVVFKEEYFSRWKAYMNEKEIPLLATHNRMMLIRTLEADTIRLDYSLLSEEKLAALLSLVAVIGLFFIFIRGSIEEAVSDQIK
jgi:hypothetical protein